MHESITDERVEAAVLDYMYSMNSPGFCHACGEDAYNVEPDARKYVCESCGQPAVHGAEETLLMK